MARVYTGLNECSRSGAVLRWSSFEARIFAQQDPPQQLLILGAGRKLGRALAPVAIRANLQGHGLRLPKVRTR